MCRVSTRGKLNGRGQKDDEITVGGARWSRVGIETGRADRRKRKRSRQVTAGEVER